jgi:hypothetical protein
MKTLYLDHHIIARETGGQPANWRTLEAILDANPDWRLAVSECNLLEIASDGDKARARRRAAFIESLKPAWIMERLDIQKREVEAFLWRHHFQIGPAPIRVFYEHLSEVVIHHARPLIGETAASWVACADPGEVAEAKRLTVNSLRTLQAAKKAQKRQIEEVVFRAWIEPKMPPRNPGGTFITPAEREELIRFCYADRERFYRECPAMGVEHFVCEARTRDPQRQPTESDAIDLQHTVLGLAYCDALVTERYAFSTAAYAAKALAPLPLATLHRTLAPAVVCAAPHPESHRHAPSAALS